MPQDSKLLELHPELDEAIRRYCDGCRGRIDSFVERRLSWRATLSTHRRALGLDLVRAPLNALLAVPLMTARKAASWMNLMGWFGAERALTTLPSGLRTDCEREVDWLTRTELL